MALTINNTNLALYSLKRYLEEAPIEVSFKYADTFSRLLEEIGNVRTETGDRILVSFASDTYTVRGVTSQDVISYEYKDFVKAGEVDWKTLIVSPMIDQRELDQCDPTTSAGRVKLANLMRFLRERAEKSLAKKKGELMFDNTSLWGGKVPYGIEEYVWSQGSSKTIFGVFDTSSDTWLKNQVDNTGYTISTSGLSPLIDMLVACRDDSEEEPDVIITTRTIWAELYKLGLSKVRVEYAEDYLSGRKTMQLFIGNARVISNPYCNSGVAYFLHSKDWYIVRLQGEEHVVMDPMIPPQQPLMRVFNIYETYNVICTRPWFQGYMSSLQ